MPRKPTGRPNGRPMGSGTLGLSDHEQHARLTLRIPAALYARLTAFAAGRSFTRGTSQLAGCVRALLEHGLSCPYKRQTGSDTRSCEDALRQTSNCTLKEGEDAIRQTATSVETRDTPWQTATSGETLDTPWQTGISTEPGDTPWQTGISGETLDTPWQAGISGEPLETPWQTASGEEPVGSAAPGLPADFDVTTYALGALCRSGHDYQGSGQSLRRRKGGECLECHRSRSQAYRQRKRLSAADVAPGAGPPALDARTARVWQLLPAVQSACGHASDGAWNRVRRADGKCWLCEQAKKAAKKEKKAATSAP